MNQFITHSAEETIAWGRNFALSLKEGDVICLHGDLGAGKTTLVRGIAQGLGLHTDEPIASPTFVIMHRYACRIPLYHFDCYRIQSPNDLVGIGFEEFVNAGGGIACIEWPEKAGDLIPKESISITLMHGGECIRHIRVQKGGKDRD